MADDWLLWQLADSALPAGSFAHSGGLEAAWQQDAVSDGVALKAFIEASTSNVAHAMLPILLAAHRDPGEFVRCDELCNATLSNHVANRASRAQGQSMLAISHRVFAMAALAQLQQEVRSGGAHGHLAPVFGVIARALDVDRQQAGRLFVFCHVRTLISAAVRLGMVGPIEGQTIQARVAPHAEGMVELGMSLPADDAAGTAPIVELLAAAHDRLYSRLFQS